MYPDLFGIEGFSMGLMMTLGALAAGLLTFFYLRKRGLEKSGYIDFILVLLATVFMGIVFAMLFENLYEAIKNAILDKPVAWTWNKTFYGGLFGGVLTFLLMYRFYFLRHNPPIMKEILKIAPAAICLGHGIGRLGCFLNGCCYGIETDAWFGVMFPGHSHKVVPTQLLEMTFLLLLAVLLFIFAVKNVTNYSFVIYMAGYGAFRFLIEFIRGDERGELPGLSPSQYWCIVLVLGAVATYFLFKKVIYKEENSNAI